jgi:hypothetical protein
MGLVAYPTIGFRNWQQSTKDWPQRHSAKPNEQPSGELRDRAAISPFALGTEGLSVQSKYRSEALQRLGLKRITLGENFAYAFLQIDGELAGKKIRDKKVDAVLALRAKAESQWLAKDYQMAHATLSEALDLLGLKGIEVPARPTRELLAIDRAVADMKSRDEKVDVVLALRAAADSQWMAKDFAAARATISQALKLLGIESRYPKFRCG